MVGNKSENIRKLTKEEQITELFSMDRPVNGKNDYLIVAAVFTDAPGVVAIYERTRSIRTLYVFDVNGDDLTHYWEQREFLPKEVYAFHFSKTSDFVDSAKEGVRLRAVKNGETEGPWPNNLVSIRQKLDALRSIPKNVVS
jgi:hypothetical protein